MSSQPFPQWLEAEPMGNVTVVRFTQPVLLTGELAEAVGEQLIGSLGDLGRRCLVLNFDRVESLTSLMIGKLIRLHQKVQGEGGRLALCTGNPVIYEIFQVVRLPLILGVYRKEEEAVQGLRASPVAGSGTLRRAETVQQA